MSPKVYWFLWVLYFVSAGILWVGGVFTLTTLIVYGFVSFGLVFIGMMCVLPNIVSHVPRREKAVSTPMVTEPAQRAPVFRPHIPMGLRTH